jgi:uncharacterized protein (DUF1501 family)
MINRRNFLKHIPLAFIPSILGTSMTAYGASPFLNNLMPTLIETDRVLVIVQLIGGNDGLNTVIPLDQYSTYKNLRSNIAIPENKILKLNGRNDIGLHPSLRAFQTLFEANELAIIQNVGYDNPNYSHFRSTDIWESASDANVVSRSGWIARYLASEYPGYANGTTEHPLAIRIGGSLGLGLLNEGQDMGITVNPYESNGLDLTNHIYTDIGDKSTKRGDVLSHIQGIQEKTSKYGGIVKKALEKASPDYTYRNSKDSYLDHQLKTVAKLIAGGLKTRIYWVSMNGFDTHAKQVDADTTSGHHATLLKQLSDGIFDFTDHCKKLNIADRVIGLTFSEFGRTIKSNNDIGTDHGESAPMFVFGKKVNGKILGRNPNLSGAILPMVYDFRSVYTSILQDWFCVPSQDMGKIISTKFASLGLTNSPCYSSIAVDERSADPNYEAITAYPNPFQESTMVKYDTNGGHTLVQVFNNEGIAIKILVNGVQDKGSYHIQCDLGDLPAGFYYVRLQNGALQQVKPIMKVR